MPRGAKIVSSPTVDLDQRERDFADIMRAQTGITSDQNLLRWCLWRGAVHLDIPVTIDTFAMRTETGRRKWPRSKQAKRAAESAV